MAQFSANQKLSQGYRDQANNKQSACGVQFVAECEIKPGMTVIDMGCGPGNLTKTIAEMVGSEGKVYGVDPDSGRIRVSVIFILSLYSDNMFKHVSKYKHHFRIRL